MQEKHLLVRARKLRSATTPFEDKLWQQLSKSKLGGHKFRRQHVIDNAIVDFFCPAKGLIVEVDGDTHDSARDEVRDRRHAAQGYSTIRFTNANVGKNIDGVLLVLLERLASLSARWPKSCCIPHPGLAMPSHPSPEGEGKR